MADSKRRSVEDDDERAGTALHDPEDTRGREPGAAARSAAPAKPGDVGLIRGLYFRVVRYIREVVAELRKVIWPTRREFLTYTAVVIVFVTAIMAYVALLDLGFAKLMFFFANPD